MSADLFSPRRKDTRVLFGGKYLQARQRGQTKGRPIPTRAVVRIVDRWVAEQEVPTEVALRQLSLNCGRKDIARTVYRIKFEQDFMSFTLADRIVCGTYGPHLWHTDPELKAAAEWLDEQTGPYCPDCWAQVDRCECVPVAA